MKKKQETINKTNTFMYKITKIFRKTTTNQNSDIILPDVNKVDFLFLTRNFKILKTLT